MLPQPSLEHFAYNLCAKSKVGSRVHELHLHAFVCKHGLESHRVLGNCLVSMLVDSGSMCVAQQTFDKLSSPNDFSWNSLITGYIKAEKLQHALDVYQKVQRHVSLHLRARASVALLKVCAKLKDLERGLEIHGEIARMGMERDVYISSVSVDMYAKCGSLGKAREVFNKLPVKNVVSWNALIAAYAKHGYGEEALKLFDQMQFEGITPDAVTILCSLKACGSVGAIERGKEIHAEIERKSLLQVDVAVGNTLVDMYVKCESLAMAQEVFNKLPARDVVSWTSLIAGYAEYGDTEEALKCFEQMRGEGISPDAVALVCGLRACGTKLDEDINQEGNDNVEEEHAERGLALGNLLDETGLPCIWRGKTELSFDKRTGYGTNSWKSDYAANVFSEDSLNNIQLKGQSLSAGASVLKFPGWESDLTVGNTLIDVHAKRGALAKAQKLFDDLSIRDKVSWNILITGYAEHGQGREALKRFEQMQLHGFLPDVVTYVCCLKACGTIGALEMGLKLHCEITKKGLLETDLIIGSTLVDMYAKCGSLAMAYKAFDKLPMQEVVSWTSLMAGYIKHGHGEEAFKIFERMQPKGVVPDVATLMSVLKGCISTGSTDKGEEIHAEIERKGFLEGDLVVGNALVDMYAKCGLLSKAQEVFDRLPLHDVVSWNSLIGGYVGHGQSEEALKCFEQMQLEGVSPDAVTYVSSLQACGKVGGVEKREEILNAIEKIKTEGLLERDPYVGSSLVHMYGKCGLFPKALQVFNEFPVRDVSIWNALISAYVDHGWGEDAIKHLEYMQLQGVSPDPITLLCSLQACGSIGAREMGQRLHAALSQKQILGKELTLSNTLVHMYAKCGSLAFAQQVFDKLSVRDVVTWSNLIAGYAEQGYCVEALKRLEWMQLEGVSPDVITFACCLKACGSIGAISQGQELHYEIVRQGLHERDLMVGNALVDMYGKCGSLTLAREVFDSLPARDVVTWNALMSLFSQQGDKNIFHVFDKMLGYGTRPDEATFSIVLSTCSRMALFDESQAYFELMSKLYHMVPTIEHHGCMIDLLSRSGELRKAVAVIKEMPFCPNLPVWRSVLGACRNWGNLEMAKEAFIH